MAAHREREVKLEVPPDFQLPDLGGLGADGGPASPPVDALDLLLALPGA